MKRRPSLNLSTFTPAPCKVCGSKKVIVREVGRTTTLCPTCNK